MQHQCYKKGMDVYRRYYEEHPDSSRAAYNLGRAFEETGNVAQAIRFLKLSLKLLASDASLSQFSRKFIRASASEHLDALG